MTFNEGRREKSSHPFDTLSSPPPLVSRFQKSTSSRLTKKVNMSVAVNIISLSEVDTVNQCFTCEMVIRAATTNIVRDGVRVKETGRAVTPGNWEPRLRFLNLLSTTSWGRQEKMTEEGELAFKYHVSGTFSEQMELFDFPFDVQDLSFILSSAIPSSYLSISELHDEASSTRQTSAVQAQNFAMSNVYYFADNLRFTNTISSSTESTSGVIRPKLTIAMKIQRKPAFHIFNTILPMMFIVAASLTSFAVDREAIAERLSVSLTILLTAVAFKLQIGDSLPQISYLTAIDQFVLLNFGFVILVVLSNALLSSLSDAVDRLALLAFGGGWVVLNVTYGVVFWRASKRNDIEQFNRFTREAEGDRASKLKGEGGEDDEGDVEI